MRSQAGIDIVAVARIDTLIRARGNGFLRRWFTPAEIDYCTRKAMPSRHFAARFAAKEAVAKVLPGRWEGPLPWQSIEILTTADGVPSVRLYGAPSDLARCAGISEISVSISHCDDYATAVALTHPAAEGGADE